MVSPLVQALSFQNSVNPVPSAVAPTDVVGAYRLATDAAEKSYAAKIAQQNAMFGGLAGLGGAGIAAFGPQAAKSLFGGGVGPATAPIAETPALAAGASPGAIGALPGLTSGATGGAGTIAADMGLGGAGAGAGSVADALGATGATAGADALAAAGTDAAAASIPEWLAALLALA